MITKFKSNRNARRLARQKSASLRLVLEWAGILSVSLLLSGSAIIIAWLIGTTL